MKVLEVNVDDIGMGGVFSLVRNIIQQRDTEDLKIDIASIEQFENPNNIRNLAEYDCSVYYVGMTRNKTLKQFYCFYNLIRLIKDKGYDCVHIHADVANKLFVSGLASRIAGVRKIILHSHASNVEGKHRALKKIFHKACRNFLKYIGTDFLACSDYAAKWMYPNIKKEKIQFINNGINLRKFQFDTVKRDVIRRKLNVEDCFVLGHVGRFHHVKNHKYLIKIFAKVVAHHPKSKLLLVGDGELKNEIQELSQNLGIVDNIIFYGVSNQVEILFQAMDCFVLPSFCEGFPIVGVEAQAAGLPVLFSNTITSTAKLIDEVKFLPITEDAIELWSNTILDISNYKRYNTYHELLERKFDISQTVETLTKLYLS